MSARKPWHCHDCEHIAPTIGKAREHSKEAPVYRGGTMWRHVLTQNANNSSADRAVEPNLRTYLA